MGLKERLQGNMFLRNMLSDLIGRSAYSKTPGNFTPYFQYRIAEAYPTGQDYYLYFPKEPYSLRYKNEIYNKLFEYQGADIKKYLEFHYTAYADKEDFLSFLWYETFTRLSKKIGEDQRLKLQVINRWIDEKKEELRVKLEAAQKPAIEQGVRQAFENAQIEANGQAVQELADNLNKIVTDRVNNAMATMEERLQSMTESYLTGNVELNNQIHLDKIIKLLKLLQEVQAPAHISKAEQLFKRFSDTDIAAILRLHFKDFKTKQLNTIQVNIRDAHQKVKDENPKVAKLTQALQDYFY